MYRLHAAADGAGSDRHAGNGARLAAKAVFQSETAQSVLSRRGRRDDRHAGPPGAVHSDQAVRRFEPF